MKELKKPEKNLNLVLINQVSIKFNSCQGSNGMCFDKSKRHMAIYNDEVSDAISRFPWAGSKPPIEKLTDSK